MYGMFYNCNALTNISGLSTWNTENVIYMHYMFADCNSLIDASAINDWNIFKVTKFSNMFKNCPSHPEFTKRAGTWSGGTFIPST